LKESGEIAAAHHADHHALSRLDAAGPQRVGDLAHSVVDICERIVLLANYKSGATGVFRTQARLK